MLHWINAFEDGDEVVVDGFFERNPEATIGPDAPAAMPGRDDAERRMFRFLDATALDPVPYRWRLDLRTGAVKEEVLSDAGSEFGTINGDHLGRPYRYCYSLVPKPGWFLFGGLRRTDIVDRGDRRVSRRRRSVRQRGADGAAARRPSARTTATSSRSRRT